MRVVAGSTSGVRDADLRQQVDGALPGLAPAQVQVPAGALGHLEAHGEHGVERGQGVLEDHRHLGAAHVAAA